MTRVWMWAAIHRGQEMHSRPQLERLADWPVRELPAGHLGHYLAVVLHALAVKGRQHQLAALHVLGLLQQHHRARAQQRAEDRVGKSHTQHRMVGGEHLLHIFEEGEGTYPAASLIGK
jgi:hypothetical protein